MRFWLRSLFILVLVAAPAVAATSFPELTGRVVDGAHILSAGTIQSLDSSLADYEHGTTNQVVVVTIPSLQGDSIEDYGYRLGRHWQIGQKDKNNGTLLIVAPAEHKVRIEVGYGLEGTLTDAACSEIIHTIILPDFRAGNMEQGVIDGTRAILAVLGGQSLHVTNTGQAAQPSIVGIVISLLLLLWFMSFASRHPFLAAWMLSAQSSRYGSSRMNGGGYYGGGGFSSGGGFSGGGGSFGGGGASGGW